MTLNAVLAALLVLCAWRGTQTRSLLGTAPRPIPLKQYSLVRPAMTTNLAAIQDRAVLYAARSFREARARISLIAQSEAAALGVAYERITLRDQRSRWGSCSSKGALSFNWRLVLAPHDVLDYVVVHEVCHLVEHHHGPEFWRLVERRRPNYRESKEWLDNYGWEILAYRPPSEVAA